MKLQITQIFQNLIDNAVKFRGAETIRESTSRRARKADKWIFSVADNGIGIDEQYKDRIFVIFQRLNPREEYGGTGIGLAVVKKIVEKRERRNLGGAKSRTRHHRIFHLAVKALITYKERKTSCLARDGGTG